MLPAMPLVPNGKAILLNTGLNDTKNDDNVQLSLSSAKEFQQYKKQAGREQWVDRAQLIVNLLPEGGVVFVRDSVNEVVAATLARNNISLVHRIPESDMTALSKLLNAPVCHSTDDLHEVAECDVECKTIGDMKYVVVKGSGEVTTLILRGASLSKFISVASSPVATYFVIEPAKIFLSNTKLEGYIAFPRATTFTA